MCCLILADLDPVGSAVWDPELELYKINVIIFTPKIYFGKLKLRLQPNNSDPFGLYRLVWFQWLLFQMRIQFLYCVNPDPPVPSEK